jgi:hypothetical protein
MAKKGRRGRQEDSRKKNPKTIVGMAYQEFRKYKKKTGMG